MAKCHDCERPYGDEHGFPDLIIPFEYWRLITPTSEDGGLLCPSCICKRLHERGLRCEGAFMSGPVRSVEQDTMQLMRRIENMECAFEGRRNRWGAALDDRIKEGGSPKAAT